MPMFSLLLRRFAGTGGDPNDVIAFVAPAGVAKVFDKVLNDNFNIKSKDFFSENIHWYDKWNNEYYTQRLDGIVFYE